MHLEYRTDKKRNTAAERGANKFAMDLLFGDPGIAPFEGLTTDPEIRQAAKNVGIAPRRGRATDAPPPTTPLQPRQQTMC